MTDLKRLPRIHPLRNAPLADIKAELSLHGGAWRQVTPSWGIAKNTFNQLGDVWMLSEWRAPT